MAINTYAFPQTKKPLTLHASRQRQIVLSTMPSSLQKNWAVATKYEPKTSAQAHTLKRTVSTRR